MYQEINDFNITKQEVEQVRKQLGEFNQEDKPLEWCVQDMRLASEQLKKTVAEAKKEIAALNREIEKYELIY